MNRKRRQLLRSLPLGMAGGLMAAGGESQTTENQLYADETGRHVWIGAVSQDRLQVGSKQEMIETILGFLEAMKAYKPDIICLPETFSFVPGMGGYGDTAEAAPYPSLTSFRQFAKQNSCYLICPIIIKENERAYNAAVLIDRRGEIIGNYKKAHPTIGEMDQGIYPGPLDPPVFDLDFGRIGIQICFDIQWSEGWKLLSAKNPDIIFWPSAFSGRTLVQTKAWECKSYTVSSTIKGAARICDISGEVIAQTEFWNRNYICAPVNLEKALIHTWPHNQHFSKIRNKYGRLVSLKTYDEEEWTILESHSRDIKIGEVLKEFNIPTFEEYLAVADQSQNEKRV
ncbi:MAG: carbon-nitrogen hydrolase family protein [Saprospiraceae bacterium]|nr:carbon-nitrogen hydrolase family protein [Saprospiraceae bacterium]